MRLKPYGRGDGFVSCTEVTAAETPKLAIVIDTLAEKQSTILAAIVRD